MILREFGGPTPIFKENRGPLIVALSPNLVGRITQVLFVRFISNLSMTFLATK